MPDKWIRVRDTSGHHISVRGDVIDGHPRGVQSGQQELKQPGADDNGQPLPPKYRTDKGHGPAPSATITARPRRGKKAAQEPVPTATDAQPEATSGQQADTGRQD